MFIPMNRGYGSRWVLKFPGFREIYPDWTTAHVAILRELQWLAMDTSSEEVWETWEAVRKWSPNGETHVWEALNVGDPPGTYTLIRYGHEKEAE
jgi:hypothetical protein